MAANGSRPGARLARAARKAGWLAATGGVILLSSGFTWILGRAAQGAPAIPLPPQEAALVHQSDALAQRIQRDQAKLDALTQQVAQLTGQQTQAAAPGGMPAGLAPHTMTGASGG